MNDTDSTTGPASGPADPPPPPPGPPGPQAPPGPSLWTRVVETRRSRSDRLLTGVAGGVGRQLDVDPVLIRVGFAALTIAGGAGIIAYLGAWVLLPADDGRPSHLARWLRLDDREPQVRQVGLAATAILAVASLLGTGWGPGWVAWSVFWVMALALGLYVLIGVLPRRGRDLRAHQPAAGPPSTHPPAQTSAQPWTGGAAAGPAPAAPTGPVPPSPVAPPPPREPRPPSGTGALLATTLGALAVVVGALGLVESIGGTDVAWTTYVASCLGVIGLGIAASAWWGNGWWLLPIALVLGAVLAVAALLPSIQMGESTQRPVAVSELESSYDWGIGRQVVDLRGLDADDLAGRTLRIDQGIGLVVVRLPAGLPVDARADVGAGDLDVLGRVTQGDERTLRVPSTAAPGDSLRLDVSMGIGQVEVTR